MHKNASEQRPNPNGCRVMTHHLHGATLLYTRVITRASHAQVTGTCMRKWDSQERACALAHPCWGQPADCETRWAREALQCVCSASMLGGLQPQASSRGRTADALLTWIPGHRSPLLCVRGGREWRVCVPHGSASLMASRLVCGILIA